MKDNAAVRVMRSCPSCNIEYPGGELFCPIDGTRLTSPSIAAMGPNVDPLVGVVVSGRYKILRRIGEGGMGIVYEAEHVVIEKHVALKVLRDDFSKRPEVVARFRQEARSASRIGHDNIIDISDFGETPNGASYFVMEMLEGEDLAMRLEREGILSAEDATDVILQCCRGLGAAHAKGIVHRDMKPENIFLINRDGRAGFVKLVDFGIAKMSDVETPGAPGRKLTKTGMIFGTPEYMSPEQAAGKDLDHRVDVYAMGVILYELLVGRVPFVGDTFMGILTQHMFETPPALREINAQVSVPAELESIVFKALAKDAADRYQSMDEMSEALQKAMGIELPDVTGRYSVIASAPHSRGKRTGRFPKVTPDGPEAFAQTYYLPGERRSHAKLWLGMLGAAVLVAAGVGFALSGKTKTPRRTEQASPSNVSASATANSPSAEGAKAAALQNVKVTVATDPPGASLHIEGKGQVCEHTPCNFEVKKGDTLNLEATKGSYHGEKTVVVQSDLQLEMNLDESEPRRNRPRRRARAQSTESHAQREEKPTPAPKPTPKEEATPPAKPAKAKVRASGDLKIPDIFQ